MARIFSSVTELMGRTPLVRLRHIEQDLGLECRLLAKVEAFNPSGSVKARVALGMLEDYRTQGLLNPDTVIIEPTSGNTGIGLACVAACWGCKAVIVMPDSMSVERRLLMEAYGAQVVLTPGALGMQGAVEEARRLQSTIPGSIIAGQFENPANARAHYTSTGPEIWEDTDGQVDVFVAGVGTGGTITGTGRFLKEQNPEIRVVAVEPADSPLLSQGRVGRHGLEGIGANFVPQVLDREIYDQVEQVTTAEAYERARQLGAREGLLVGISSGAALEGAVKVARQPENRGKTIVVLLPDTGERYLSTPLFQ